MSGVEDTVLEASGDRSATRDSGATLVNGLFYGGLAYLVGYLWVYVNIMNEDIPDQAAAAIYGGSATEVGEESLETISMLVPGTGDYAGWVYHYAMGGTISWSVNFLPGSQPLNEAFLYHFDGGPQDRLRETVLTEPWMLLHPSEARYYVEAIQGPTEFAELSFVFITPTALFFAGFFLAYRHKELTPLGGALAGSKVTAGFLLASIASTYVFTVSISGFSFGAEGAMQVFNLEAGGFAEVEPEITIGPSMSRGILIGVVYPLAFGTLGGAAASGAAIVRLPGRLARRFLL